MTVDGELDPARRACGEGESFDRRHGVQCARRRHVENLGRLRDDVSAILFFARPVVTRRRIVRRTLVMQPSVVGMVARLVVSNGRMPMLIASGRVVMVAGRFGDRSDVLTTGGRPMRMMPTATQGRVAEHGEHRQDIDGGVQHERFFGRTTVSR